VAVEGRPLDEAQLVERARHGDQEAYVDIVRMYEAKAFRLAYLFTRNAEDAEDAAQEAFVKAWRALGRFRAGERLEPWLLRIVANEAKNRRRSVTRRSSLTLRAAEEFSGDAAPSPEDDLVLRERRGRVLDEVERLPEGQRDVVVCRYLLELSEAETAEVLALRRGTVKSRLARALARLEDALGGVR
jgi:RNA polymerase sigma-70 factor (ECF subfamily)